MAELKKVNRRRFLKLAGGAVGAGMLACVGGGLIVLRQPKVETPTSACEGSDSREKVLVAYATRAGSTAEVADAIGRTLCEAGIAVDVLPARDVQDLSPYRAVVLGSAVYMGRMLRDASVSVNRHEATLSQMPVASFVVCVAAKDDTAEARAEASSYLQPVREVIAPVAEGIFARRILPENLPLAYRWAVQDWGDDIGDLRDWDAIATWGAELASAFG
jgi:menaquinone-dependent protoporphyrinogen oxidase